MWKDNYSYTFFICKPLYNFKGHSIRAYGTQRGNGLSRSLFLDHLLSGDLDELFPAKLFKNGETQQTLPLFLFLVLLNR
jgi:hypothetical protein